MKPQFIGGLLVSLVTCLCSACASKALAPPRCDLATAVPINASSVSTMSDASGPSDPSEDAAINAPGSQDEVPAQ